MLHRVKRLLKRQRKQKLFRSMISVGVVTAAIMIALPATAAPLGDNGEIKIDSAVHYIEVITIYKNEAGREKVLSVAKEIVKEFNTISALTVVIDESEIDKLKSDPNIDSVERNVKLQIEGSYKTSEPIKIAGTREQENNWGFQAVNKDGSSFANRITGKGVKVAVIDSGISPHTDLKIAGGVSTVDYTDSYSDDHGHGTHVAGIIGALNNGQGIVGVAPEVDLYAIKAMGNDGEGYLIDVVEGIDWAINKDLDIINLSLGSTTPMQSIKAVLDKAENSGILVVAAAGNDGSAPVNYPAQYESTIAVSAIDSNKQLASFSNYGPSIDVTAPGVGIVSTYNDGTNYARGNGTSQAAPHVTGVLALLRQQFPDLSAEQLKAKLYQSVEDLGESGRDDKFGYGLAKYVSSESTQESGENQQTNTNQPVNEEHSNAEIPVVEDPIDQLNPVPNEQEEEETTPIPAVPEPAPTLPTQPSPVPSPGSAPTPGTTPVPAPVQQKPQPPKVEEPKQEQPKQEIPKEPTKQDENSAKEAEQMARVVKKVKEEARTSQKQFAAKIIIGTDALKARQDLKKTISAINVVNDKPNMEQAAKVIGQYQAVISYYAETKSYTNVLATVKEATVGLAKKKVDPVVIVETVLKPNVSSSSSANTIIAEFKKNKLDTNAVEVFRNELKQAEIGKSIMDKHQQKASAFAKRKSYSNVVKQISAGVIEATKAKAPNNDILAFVKKNVKSASSVQFIINEMKKAKLNTTDLEKYKKELMK